MTSSIVNPAPRRAALVLLALLVVFLTFAMAGPRAALLMLVGLGFAGLLRRGAIKGKASIQRTELCESGWNQR